MNFKSSLDEILLVLKNIFRNTQAKAIVDVPIGGHLLKKLKEAYRNIRFIHVGEIGEGISKDDEIIEYAKDNNFDIILTMDYGMARKALLRGLHVILILESENHKYYLVTYLAPLGDVKIEIKSTL